MSGDFHSPSATGATPSDDAECVLRVRKFYRNLGFVFLAFCLFMGCGQAYLVWMMGQLDGNLGAVVVVCSFWTCMGGLSVWQLLTYWRQCLTIRGGKLIFQGVVHCKDIDLATVTEVRWKIGSRVVLRTASQKLTIHLDNFERAEGLWLIRRLRDGLPQSVQQGWESFCYKVAIPLRDSEAPEPLPLRKDQVLITRRRWDWIFVPFIALTAVIGGVLHWKLQRPQMWAAPLGPIALWLLMRCATPKRGWVDKRIGADPQLTRLCLLLAWWLGTFIAGAFVYEFAIPPMRHREIVAAVLCVVWFGVFVWRMRLIDRGMNQRDLEGARIAAQQWTEREGAVDPDGQPCAK